MEAFDLEIKDTDSIGYADTLRIIFGDKCVRKVLDNERQLDFTFAEVFHVAVDNGYSEGTIIVIAESPLEGKVFQYGNYGDFWVEHGHTRGYA